MKENRDKLFEFKIRECYYPRKVGQASAETYSIITFRKKRYWWFTNKWWWSRWKGLGINQEYFSIETFKNKTEAAKEIERLKKDLSQGRHTYFNLD